MKRSNLFPVLGILAGLVAVALAVVAFTAPADTAAREAAAMPESASSAPASAASPASVSPDASPYGDGIRPADSEAAGARRPDAAPGAVSVGQITELGFSSPIRLIGEFADRLISAFAGNGSAADGDAGGDRGGTDARGADRVIRYGMSGVLLAMGVAMIILCAARIRRNKAGGTPPPDPQGSGAAPSAGGPPEA